MAYKLYFFDFSLWLFRNIYYWRSDIFGEQSAADGYCYPGLRLYKVSQFRGDIYFRILKGEFCYSDDHDVAEEDYFSCSGDYTYKMGKKFLKKVSSREAGLPERTDYEQVLREKEKLIKTSNANQLLNEGYDKHGKFRWGINSIADTFYIARVLEGKLLPTRWFTLNESIYGYDLQVLNSSTGDAKIFGSQKGNLYKIIGFDLRDNGLINQHNWVIPSPWLQWWFRGHSNEYENLKSRWLLYNLHLNIFQIWLIFSLSLSASFFGIIYRLRKRNLSN